MQNEGSQKIEPLFTASKSSEIWVEQNVAGSKDSIRILCISDDVDPLVYSNGIQERFAHVDIVLSAGDLYFNYYNYIVSMLNKPLYFVFGNHNLKYLSFYRKSFQNAMGKGFEDNFQAPAGGGIYVGDRVIYLKKYRLIIVGLGGCRCYNKGPNQFSEFQMFCKILRLLPRMFWNRIVHGRYLDILLTHAAPRGINDKDDPCHKGFQVFLWFMRTFSPKYLLHGHIHLYNINSPRISKYKNTKIINVYSRYELEYS